MKKIRTIVVISLISITSLSAHQLADHKDIHEVDSSRSYKVGNYKDVHEVDSSRST